MKAAVFAEQAFAFELNLRMLAAKALVDVGEPLQLRRYIHPGFVAGAELLHQIAAEAGDFAMTDAKRPVFAQQRFMFVKYLLVDGGIAVKMHVGAMEMFQLFEILTMDAAPGDELALFHQDGIDKPHQPLHRRLGFHHALSPRTWIHGSLNKPLQVWQAEENDASEKKAWNVRYRYS